MYGSGIYSLDSVKEVRITEDFKTLTESQKKCQTHETYEHCLTNQIRTKTIKNCDCIPFELQNFSEPLRVIH